MSVVSVSDARAALGLEPLTADGFPMSPEELKAKADAQNRDNEGKFEKEADVVATLPEGMEPVDITQPAEEATPPPPPEGEEATPPPPPVSRPAPTPAQAADIKAVRESDRGNGALLRTVSSVFYYPFRTTPGGTAEIKARLDALVEEGYLTKTGARYRVAPTPPPEAATPPPPPGAGAMVEVPASEVLPDDDLVHEGERYYVTDVTTGGGTTSIAALDDDMTEQTFSYPSDQTVKVWDPNATPEPEPEPEAETTPDDGVRSMTGQEAKDALEAAGRPPTMANDRRLYTTDGRNFVAVDLPGKQERQRLQWARQTLERKTAEQARGYNYGPGYAEELANDIAQAEREIAHNEALLADMGEDVTPEQEAQAKEALGYLDKAMAAAPDALKAKSVIVHLTGSGHDAGANTIARQGIIEVNPTTFGRSPESTGYYMRTPFANYGEYAINHGLGHVLDVDGDSRRHDDVHRWARVRGMSRHGEAVASEGYAEAFTAWMGGDRSPMVQKYAETFGWGGEEEEAATEPEPEEEAVPDEQGRLSMTGKQARDALVAAGYDPQQAARLANGRVFTRDGHTFVAQGTAKTEAQRAVAKADKAVGKAEDKYRYERTEARFKSLERAERKLERAKQAYADASTEVTEDQEAMAHEALDFLEKAVAKLPEGIATPRGRRRSFVANLDWDAAPGRQGGLVAGLAQQGGTTMWVNPRFFREPVSGGDWHMNTPEFATDGEHTINHELGHLIDSRSDTTRKQTAWRAAKRRGEMSRYGETNAIEGFAEAFAAWQGGDRSESVREYARTFGWDVDEVTSAEDAEEATSPSPEDLGQVRADSLQPGDVFYSTDVGGEWARVIEARSAQGNTVLDVELVADGFKEQIELPSDTEVRTRADESATPPPPPEDEDEEAPLSAKELESYRADSLLPGDVVTHDGQPVTVTDTITRGDTTTITGTTPDGETVEFDVPADEEMPLGGSVAEAPPEPEPEGTPFAQLKVGDRFRNEEGEWEVTAVSEAYGRQIAARIVQYSDGSGAGSGQTTNYWEEDIGEFESLGNPYESTETVNASDVKIGDAILTDYGPLRVGGIRPHHITEDGTVTEVVVEGAPIEGEVAEGERASLILSVAHNPDAYGEQKPETAQRVEMAETPEDTYEADVEAAQAALADLLEKYPDGVAEAIKEASTIKPPDPLPSEDLQAMGREIAEAEADPATVAWREAYEQAKADADAATEAAGEVKPWRVRTDEDRAELDRRYDAMWAAIDAQAQLEPKAWGIGDSLDERSPLLTDDVIRLERRKAEYESLMAQWREIQELYPQPTERSFANPEAQEVLAEVEAVGAKFREAIDKEVERRIATGEGVAYPERYEESTEPLPWGSPEREAREQNRQRAAREAGTLRERTRATLTREAVATAQPQATETVQTWESKEDPKYGEEGEHIAAERHLRDLTPEEKAAMTEALLLFPESWVGAFDRYNPEVTTSMRTRGYNSSDRGHIAISDGTGDGASDFGDMQETMVHEFGHTMERAVPGLLDLEAAFWASRTGQEPRIEADAKRDDGGYYPQSEGEGGKGFSPGRYTMKRYGWAGTTPRAYEVFTTGVEEVLGDGGSTFTSDGDDTQLWDFTMGALLVLGNDGHTIRMPKPVEDEDEA